MHIIEFPALPLTTPIYGGFNTEAEIKIHGTTFLGSQNGFVLELLSQSGIAFHFNVRMGCYGGENVIVINNMSNGAWLAEERHSNFFCLNQHFHLTIKCHASHFSIHINGRHLTHFHHRESPFAIHSLTMRGDVRVEKIHFEHFLGHNGGGVQVGGGAAPGVVVASAPPPVVVAAPAPTVVVAPRPAPVVEVVVPPRRPLIDVVVAPRRPLIGGVVVVEKGGHHHHHHRHH